MARDYESKYSGLPDEDDEDRKATRPGGAWFDAPSLERMAYDKRLDFTKVAKVFPLAGRVAQDER